MIKFNILIFSEDKIKIDDYKKQLEHIDFDKVFANKDVEILYSDCCVIQIIKSGFSENFKACKVDLVLIDSAYVLNEGYANYLNCVIYPMTVCSRLPERNRVGIF